MGSLRFSKGHLDKAFARLFQLRLTFTKGNWKGVDKVTFNSPLLNFNCPLTIPFGYERYLFDKFDFVYFHLGNFVLGYFSSAGLGKGIVKIFVWEKCVLEP